MERTDQLSEDMAVVKSKMIHMEYDVQKILHILMESDDSMLGKLKVNETKIRELEKNHWHAKTAIFAALISIILSAISKFSDSK